jgi:colanic acid biosynthesis glycosyl transferase WcaI
MTGLISSEELVSELSRATLSIVAQSYDGAEFNVPSKLMNYLASGLPVVGSVSGRSEAARIIEVSGAGSIAERGKFGEAVYTALNEARLTAQSEAAFRFAKTHLAAKALAERFDREVFQHMNM